MTSIKTSLFLLSCSLAVTFGIPIDQSSKGNLTTIPSEIGQANNLPGEGVLPTFVKKTSYVAFGDSYAAGIGAGITKGDGCRVGSGSYPNQVQKWAWNGHDALEDFQNLPCSGAVVTEVVQDSGKGQIDKWNKPWDGYRASISIGGNDVGFYNVLTACVLRVGQGWAGDCDDVVKKAYENMNDPKFRNNVNTALHQIISNANRPYFKIIQTGYPRFFNDKTASCDYSTFYFWDPGYHWWHRPGEWAYLYKERRNKLNNLVDDLNRVLKEILDGVNQELGSTRVIWEDPNPAFEGHRFCEEGITEPDSGNQNNWFFLSTWPDHGSTAFEDAIGELAEKESVGTLQIPDNQTCATSHDWAVKMLCEMKLAGIASDKPNGEKGIKLLEKTTTPDGSEVSIDEVSGTIPTRWAKTFHPRTNGHTAYRNMIIRNWN